MRLHKRRKNKRKKLLKVMLATVYIFILTMVGLGFNGTYAIFNTLARTPPGEAIAADEQDILKVTGEFDVENWLDTGDSGFVVTNVSPGKLWVYFSIEGSLGEAVQHINPVCLKAGESFKIPVRPARLDELGLLDWRNNKQTFTGKIVVRVLNNYSSYEVGTVTIDGEELYARMVEDRDDPEGQVREIKSVKDLLRLIAEKMALIEERDQLKQEKERLIELNDELTRDKARLEDRIATLEEHIDSLSESLGNAGDLIDQLSRQPEPVDNPGQPEPGNSGSEAPGTGNQGSGSTGTGGNEAGYQEPAGAGTGGTGTDSADPVNPAPGNNGTEDPNPGNSVSGEAGSGNQAGENGSGNAGTGNSNSVQEDFGDEGLGGTGTGNPGSGGTDLVNTGAGGAGTDSSGTGGSIPGDFGTGGRNSVNTGSDCAEQGNTNANAGPSSSKDKAASPEAAVPATEPPRVTKNDGEQTDS
ncbi:hypothetical protein IT084_09740 [Desulfallas sp. Bu1-1]|uniref:coiled-coil domain-containing protein n=1 Tax=Desulfallas sp. Bu1-1 TaxID=2787620 RepID=UPI00189F6B48|nr:hypothetical protein [Desulfallas sp. Bu1-1]MBF7083255.1 hypothetical protein [Desulfallas sp. Bu1-1]